MGRKGLAALARAGFWRRSPSLPTKPPTGDVEAEMKEQILALIRTRQPLSCDPSRPVFLLEPEGLFYASFPFSGSAAELQLPRASADFSVELNDGEEEELLLVYVNPKLEQLLTALRSQTYALLYTSSRQEAAEAILAQLGADRLNFIAQRLFQNDCLEVTLEEEGVCELAKSLAGLGLPPERTVLVDHKPLSFLLESGNAYAAAPFRPGAEPNPVDRLLADLPALNRAADVRPLLAEWFNVRRTLVEIDLIAAER